jgi:hypothetical protein
MADLGRNLFHGFLSGITVWLTGRLIAKTSLSVGFLGFLYILLLQRGLASLNPDQIYVAKQGG